MWENHVHDGTTYFYMNFIFNFSHFSCGKEKGLAAIRTATKISLNYQPGRADGVLFLHRSLHRPSFIFLLSNPKHSLK